MEIISSLRSSLFWTGSRMQFGLYKTIYALSPPLFSLLRQKKTKNTQIHSTQFPSLIGLISQLQSLLYPLSGFALLLCDKPLETSFDDINSIFDMSRFIPSRICLIFGRKCQIFAKYFCLHMYKIHTNLDHRFEKRIPVERVSNFF